DSAVTVMKALSVGLRDSMRARHACASSTGEILFCRRSRDASDRLSAVGPVSVIGWVAPPAASAPIAICGMTPPAAPANTPFRNALRDMCSSPLWHPRSDIGESGIEHHHQDR